MKKSFFFCYLLLYTSGLVLRAQQVVGFQQNPASFSISKGVSIVFDTSDDWLVKKVATLLQTDMESVTGSKPALVNSLSSSSKLAIIIGTIEGSSIIKKLISAKKLDVKNLEGKWEAFRLQTMDKPFAGVDKALIIVGSDNR